MTGKEFDQWWTDFKIRFPDLGGPWFAEGRNESQQRMILNGFAEVLRDVALQESLTVNKAMQRGDLEGFGGKWERDEIARRVRKHAIDQRPANTWTGPKDDPQQPRTKKDYDLGGAMRRLIEMREKGASAEECDAYLQNRFPPAPAESQRWFKCLLCLDSGRVEVWHYERVLRAKRDGLYAALQCANKTTAAACSCKAGEPFGMREKQPLVTYDRTKHCLAKYGDVESEAAVAAFQEWLVSHDRVENRSNFEPSFANY